MGKRTRNVYRLGDKVSIKVSAVDIVNRRIDFILKKNKKSPKKKQKKVDSYAGKHKSDSTKQKSKA